MRSDLDRVEWVDIGLPYPVAYCLDCGLSVDVLSGEDCCGCDWRAQAAADEYERFLKMRKEGE